MLVSDAEKNPEDKIRKTSMPNSTLIGMSLKENKPLVAMELLFSISMICGCQVLNVSYQLSVISFNSSHELNLMAKSASRRSPTK
jgi:hypothetical protein